MWAEVNGERKKVACGPCIRGHRSSKCDHRDRVLVEVRKPGRPLSSCPHPSGSCSCERVVINYTIPKSSECACPSERGQPTATVAGNSRIQKHRRKSTAITATSLAKAIRADQDAETDTSSVTHAQTDKSTSNDPTPVSSASSTPRLLPARKESISSCCKPKAKPAPPVAQAGGCCGSKAKKAPEPEPVPVKSCCGGPPAPARTLSQNRPDALPHYQQQTLFQAQSKGHLPQFPAFQPHPLPPSSVPFSLGTPIYNHAAAAYQQSAPVPMSPIMNGSMSGQIPGPQIHHQAPKHNCHCGDSCSCFGCAAHPSNATMMEYVRLMAQFQYTGGFGTVPAPLYDMPTYPHHPGYGAEANQVVPFSPTHPGISTPTPTQMGFRRDSEMSMMSNQSISASASWLPPVDTSNIVAEPQFLEPHSYTASTPIMTQLSLKIEDSVEPQVIESPCAGTEEETPTLSPSSYFWNEVVLPGCSDATGTCQCGDGCECVGCLTHGGHNGVLLNTPTGNAQTTFPDFGAGPQLALHDTSSFLAFNMAPT